MPAERDPLKDFVAYLVRQKMTEADIALLITLAETWLAFAKKNSGAVTAAEVTDVVLLDLRTKLFLHLETFAHMLQTSGYTKLSDDMTLEVT